MWYENYVYTTPRFIIESKKFTKIKKKMKIPRVIDVMMKDGIARNSCLAQWSKGRKKRLLYLHPKLSLVLVPYRILIYDRLGIVRRKMVLLKNLIFHFPTCYAYSVKKPIGHARLKGQHLEYFKKSFYLRTLNKTCKMFCCQIKQNKYTIIQSSLTFTV